jgi:IS30 family transposase
VTSFFNPTKDGEAMKSYKQLSQAQRYQMELLKKAGKKNKEVVELVKTSELTVSRELKRNESKGGYCDTQAQVLMGTGLLFRGHYQTRH